ncbi:Protoheme IX farnesyltransferase [invertebrate metagenome]|uniref:Protoheme IX farnesyltransferase n=1 Tax=invertebrate metagenome TaxID=1711999 RepID=A0A2H9T8L6_9ZZZZ
MDSIHSEKIKNLTETPRWRDFLELTKPKVVMLMLLTSVIGMYLATPGWVPIYILLFGNLGIALCAGAAATINHVVDRRIDTQMHRTSQRPVAQGRIPPAQAILFALFLGSSGLLLLFMTINALTGWLTLFSLLGYAVIYTALLKRATPQNIVIGGLAGAAPPLLGWTAVSGQLDSYALLPVLIIFAWTPPHFWALAIHRKAEYAKANIPMLPVTHGEAYTRLYILLYTLLLCVVTLLPFVTGMSGLTYLVIVFLLNLRFLYWAVTLLKNRRPRAAIHTFRYSITYLLILFIALLIDHQILINA